MLTTQSVAASKPASAHQLVVSDVDGTITKSDVLGHLMPRVGYDWSHLGVTSLYSRITDNGYQMMYLTARGIGMAGTTRDYLASIQQGDPASKQESKLPDGPCLLSPSGLIESAIREVILRKPEEFKIACLQDIRSLWPASHNPFYAGFGNRGSDVIAYREAGVPPSRILVINPQGEIHFGGNTYCWASYPKLVQLSNEMFPAVASSAGGDDSEADECYTDLNFWRLPLPALPPEERNSNSVGTSSPAGGTPPPLPPPPSSSSTTYSRDDLRPPPPKDKDMPPPPPPTSKEASKDDLPQNGAADRSRGSRASHEPPPLSTNIFSSVFRSSPPISPGRTGDSPPPLELGELSLVDDEASSRWALDEGPRVSEMD